MNNQHDLKPYIIGLAVFVLITAVVFNWLFSSEPEQDPKDFSWYELNTPIAMAAYEAPVIKIELEEEPDSPDILASTDIKIKGPRQKDASEDFEVELVSSKNGEYEFKFKPKASSFKPGKYTAFLSIKTTEGIRDFTQDFYWGVLAINPNKSVYLPNGKAYLQMGVLTDTGDTICDAKLTLLIRNPKEEIIELTNFAKNQDESGQIINNPECGPNNVINTPDYWAYYQLNGPGIYQMVLTAETINGVRTILDYIEVKKSLPFEIERIGPTRIYPPAVYEMTLRVKVNQDFKGEVIETMPGGFEIVNQEMDGSEVTRLPLRQLADRNDRGRALVWQVDWRAGETYELAYTFDAPDISPEFYLLGPLEFYQ